MVACGQKPKEDEREQSFRLFGEQLSRLQKSKEFCVARVR